MTFWHWLQKSKSPRRLDLVTFQPLLKESTKPISESSIRYLSGLGLLAVDPEVDKTMVSMNFE